MFSCVQVAKGNAQLHYSTASRAERKAIHGMWSEEHRSYYSHGKRLTHTERKYAMQIFGEK